MLSDEEKKRIFVFDEDYVDKNIKLRDSGLDTIIMWGQQAEIEARQKQYEYYRDKLLNFKEKEVSS